MLDKSSAFNFAKGKYYTIKKNFVSFNCMSKSSTVDSCLQYICSYKWDRKYGENDVASETKTVMLCLISDFQVHFVRIFTVCNLIRHIIDYDFFFLIFKQIIGSDGKLFMFLHNYNTVLRHFIMSINNFTLDALYFQGEKKQLS